MALPANALTTLATVYDELTGDVATDNGGPIDLRLERYIRGASALVRQVCGRDFEFAQAVVEKAAGYGFTFLYARRFPIVTLTQVKVNDGVLDASSYELRDAGTERSKVYRAAGWYWSASTAPTPEPLPVPGTEKRNIELTYDGGYVTPQQVFLGTFPTRTLPDDLEDAVVELVVSRWRGRGVDKRAVQESGQNKSITWGGLAVPPSVQAVIEAYAQIAHA